MGNKNKMIFVLWAALLLITLVSLGGVTYAWFTFDPYTKVEPISSTISDGDTALLISNDRNAEFGIQCTLPVSTSEALEPVSTADLNRFYAAKQQNRDGISVTYQDVTGRLDADTIHGTIYLQSLKNDCAVYLNREGLSFGEDGQLLAALRLGLKITTAEGEQTYIFRLDEMGNTAGAAARQTTSQSGVVIGGLSAGDGASFAADPAQTMSRYFVRPAVAEGEPPQAGDAALCRIQANEIAEVSYFLYLEGCDENCINEVQNKEVSLQLSFAGVSTQTGE